MDERVNTLYSETFNDEIDVLLLQEVNPKYLELLRSVFSPLYTTQAIPEHFPDGKHGPNGQAILVSHRIDVDKLSEVGKSVISLQTSVGNFMCAHFPWGAAQAAARVATAQEIEEFAATTTGTTVLGGDFNDVPNSQPLRYLTGLEEVSGSGASWTSCWEERETFPTARFDGGWAQSTARGVGITHPELLPHHRTIDYLLTRGWNHGFPGSFLKVEKFGISRLRNGWGLSDHYGILAEILTA